MTGGPLHYFGFIRRKIGLSHEDFSSHWATTHRDLVLAGAGQGVIVKYVQDVGLQNPPEGFRSDFDGSPELWIRDEQALSDLFSSPEFQQAYHEDSPKFIEMPAVSFFVQDMVLLDGPSDGVKLIRLVAAPSQPDTQAELRAQWARQMKPLGMENGAAPLRLVRSIIVGAEAEGTDASHYLGIECSWWPDEAHAVRAWNARDTSRIETEQLLLARERIAFG